MAFIMLGTGIFLTVRFRCFQFTHLIKSIKNITAGTKSVSSEGITPFQAMATALGGSIGTANIAGVAGAIITGGPGAVFWMWTAGLFGMAVKCCEIILAKRYKGGAMSYIELGMGSIFRPLAVLFSVFGILSSLLGAALVQSNTIAVSALDMIKSYGVESNDTAVLTAVGIFTAVLTAIVILGGAERIGRFSEKAVPLMAAVYIMVSFAVIFVNSRRLLPALRSIILSAFGIRPLYGGISGACFIKAVKTGVARGVYSNEAGVGSAPMAYAASNEKDPVKQGMVGIFEVFIDTIVMCTLTALVILTSGVYNESVTGYAGITLAGMAFSTILGERAASTGISVMILLFAYTSIIGWSVYGETCFKYLFRSSNVLLYRVIYLLFIPFGAVVSSKTAWTLGEDLNLLMAMPNIIALLYLSSKAKAEIIEYKMFEKSKRKHYNSIRKMI